MGITKQLTVAIDCHNFFYPFNGSQWLPSTVWFHIISFFSSILWKSMVTVNCLIPYFFHAMEVNGYHRLFGSIFFTYYGSEWLPSTVWFHIFYILWKWMATIDCLVPYFCSILWKSMVTVNCLVPYFCSILRKSMVTVNCLIPYFFHAMEVNGYHRPFGSIFLFYTMEVNGYRQLFGSIFLFYTMEVNGYRQLFDSIFFPCYGSEWLPSTVWFHIFYILWKWMATIDCLVPYFFHAMEVNGYHRLFGSIFFPCYGSEWLPSTVWFHIFYILWKWMATIDCLVPYFFHTMEVNGYHRLFGSIFFTYYGSEWLPSTVWFHIFSILWKWMATIDCLVPYFFHAMEVNGYHRLFGSIFFPCYGSEWLPSIIWLHIISFFFFLSILWKSSATVNGQPIAWFQMFFFPKLKRSMANINSFITHILQNIIFCVQQKKRNSYRNIHTKFYRVNNERFFSVNSPFKNG